jgi:leader peptidase (prepilin peptidase) / N-methyltransferase
MPPPEIQPGLAGLPFWYWGLVFFVFGAIFGSLANVCIHRMPLEQSIITPRSHCPKCGYMIPWFHNIPLWSWLSLGGRCASCRAPISPRYFLVELLTGAAFLSCWLVLGEHSPAVAVVICAVMFGFIVATFIDFEHFIIPDEITLGGIVVGFLASTAVPMLHSGAVGGFIDPLTGDLRWADITRPEAMKASALGIAVGGGLIYAILRAGKLLFGRRQVALEGESRVVFTETELRLPKETLPFEEVFYRKSDTVAFHAKQLELVDRCHYDVEVRLTPAALQIGEEKLAPEAVPHMEAVTENITLPREAMGLGDVKFMAAIGAFLGWQAVIFTLTVSALIGSAVGLATILLGRRDWSSKIPYGPYIALAATIWMFFGAAVTTWWFGVLQGLIGPGPLPPGAMQP